MKKLLLSFLLLPQLVFAAVEYDLRKGIDLTGTNYVTFSLLNQLVDLGTTATNKGMVIRKTTRPDVTLNTRYTNFLWLDTALGAPGTLKQYVCCGDADTNWVTASLGVNSVAGTNIVDYTITESEMGTNSVNQYALQGNIPGSKLADNSIPQNKLAATSVSQGNIYPNAIRGQDITNQTIRGTNLVDGTIDVLQIAANAITTIKITNGAITFDKMATNSVGENQITNAAVSTNKLAGSINTSLMTTNVNAGLAKAWGVISAAGSLVRGYNIASAARRDTGDFLITFAAGYAPSTTNYVVTISPIRVQACAASMYSNSVASFAVNLNSVDGSDVDEPFTFQILDF